MGTFNNFYELTKPRLSMLSVFSALIALGFIISSISIGPGLTFFVIS